MRILALIPARGGSKRLPGKNIKLLGGKPLINWSIEVALKSPDLIDVVVSTDDPAIASVAKISGATVPWLRPGRLATDESTSVDMALHALDWYESKFGSIDGLLLLQPTSPFRSLETIARAIDLFKDTRSQTIVGISKITNLPLYVFNQSDKNLTPFYQDKLNNIPNQFARDIYALNGAIYLISPEILRLEKSFGSRKIVGLKIDTFSESLDIDTTWDFFLAEQIIKFREQMMEI